MIRVLGTIFAALLGLAFGSFLNVCLSRWPAGESIATPRSHCRNCLRTLPWWENIPLVSWIALRGRCRGCGSSIGVRYLAIEAATGALFALEAWQALRELNLADTGSADFYLVFVNLASRMAFFWLLLALAALDLEYLWLPNAFTLPGIVLGCIANFAIVALESSPGFRLPSLLEAAEKEIIAIVAGAGIIVVVRWAYWAVRRREGIGMGDAKLMALLGAWLGLPGLMLAFAIGVVLGALVATSLVLIPAAHRDRPWASVQLPLGTFLSIGGIVSGLWGEPMITAYMRWAGL